MREDIDLARAHKVTTKAGVVLWVEPLRFTPAQILDGDPAALFVLGFRDRWVAHGIGRGELPGGADFVSVVLLTLAQSYPESTNAERDSWLAADDPDALVSIARIGCGILDIRDRARTKALALTAVGMGAAPLTAQEIAHWADWAANARDLPASG